MELVTEGPSGAISFQLAAKKGMVPKDTRVPWIQEYWEKKKKNCPEMDIEVCSTSLDLLFVC
jgi:hypothetical protein